MISMNAVLAIRAMRMYDAGKPDEGWNVLKGLTGNDLKEAARVLEEQAILAEKIMEIGKRHGRVRENDKLGAVLKRAAAAGDEDAKLMILSGVLDKRVF